MKTFRIALVQHDTPVRQTKRNLGATCNWAKRAKQAGAALVCFPELNLTGHAGHPAMVEKSQPVPGGECVTALLHAAKELDLFLCAGIAEDDKGIYYNTQLLVGPDGYVGKQRKVHLSGDEYFYFRPGAELPVFDLPLACVGIIICYDNLFPEVSRCLALRGAELLLCPHAARFGKWPKEDATRRRVVAANKATWKKIHSCRAYDNGCYVALCNTTGRSAIGLRGVEANHAGGCIVFDPNGEVVAESRSRDICEEMLVVEISGMELVRRRHQACFNLRTRRPEVYRALTEQV